ncbi:MAG: hypothetical protein U5Q44_10310 [Dehalococcoidia bacterium]|nr:hypothetical protein [Dehalococcoidia bacterium]
MTEQRTEGETATRGLVLCPTDGVETALRCGRCDQPICPRCMVMSPVGARCKTCSPMRKAPMYTLGVQHILRAVGTALIGGAVMGIAWGLVGSAFSFGFLLLLVGVALGWAFTKMMEFGTGYKRGPIVVACAVGGLLMAWGMQFLFMPAGLAQVQLVAVAVACYWVYSNLR